MAGEERLSTNDAEHLRLQKALRESLILRELTDILNSSLDLEHILQKLVTRTTEVCEIKRCAVWLLEEAGAESRFRPITYYIAESQLAREILKAGDAIWYRSSIALNDPLIQRMLAKEGMLLVENLRVEQTMQTFAQKFQVHSVLLIALVRDGRPVGMMSLDNPGQTSIFSQDQQQLARAIAQQATIAINNARLYQQAHDQQRRAEHLIKRARAVYHVAMTANSGEDLAVVLKLATNYLVTSLGANDSLTMLLNPDETSLHPVTPDHQKMLSPSLELAHLPHFQHAISTGQPVILAVDKAREEEQSWFRLLNLKSLLIVPLMVGTAYQRANGNLPGNVSEPLDGKEVTLLPEAHCVGLIAVHYTKRREPTRGEYAFARDIAAQCALAIEKAHLQAETRKAADLANERANTLDAVFQAMNEGICIIKPDGQIEIRNNAAARFLNVPVYSSVPLATFFKQHPPLSSDCDYEHFPLQQALSGEIQLRGQQFLVTRADGARLILESSARPLKNSDRQTVGLAIAFRDITTQVQAEQRVRQALDAFLYIAEAVSHSTDIREILHITLAKTLTTLYCQRGMVHLLPQDQQTFHLALSLGFSPDDETRWLKEQESWLSQEKGQAYGFYQKIMSGQVTLISAEHCPVQPNPFAETMILAAPIKHDQQILGLILLDRSRFSAPPQSQQSSTSFTNWDITIVEGIAQLAGMAMEQARWQQEAIKARANEDMMREADAMKNEFLAMTAHEFRTPLAVILMRSQSTLRTLRRTAKDGTISGAPATPIEEHLEIIAAQAKQLNNIVTTFLDAARINQGQFSLKSEVVDLARIARQVIEDQAHLVEKHKLRCTLRSPRVSYLVQGDQARLSQVIANLVENAIKYSPFGGPITVTLRRRVKREAGCKFIEVYVKDKGIGIPAEAQARLFERFYRAPNAAGSETRGVGLGLYIVGQLVTMHGGEIRVESSGIPGQGSCFIVTLPALPS